MCKDTSGSTFSPAGFGGDTWMLDCMRMLSCVKSFSKWWSWCTTPQMELMGLHSGGAWRLPILFEIAAAFAPNLRLALSSHVGPLSRPGRSCVILSTKMRGFPGSVVGLSQHFEHHLYTNDFRKDPDWTVFAVGRNWIRRHGCNAWQPYNAWQVGPSSG